MIELPAATIEAQHGLITTEQLGVADFTPKETLWLVKSQRCERLSPRVLRLVGAPRNETQRVLAAVLDAGPGSALSHTSALAWWNVPGFTLDELHVTHARDGVHRPRRLAHFVHQEADRIRISRLEAAGFVVVAVTDVDVWQRPQKVADIVRDGRREARSRQSR